MTEQNEEKKNAEHDIPVRIFNYQNHRICMMIVVQMPMIMARDFCQATDRKFSMLLDLQEMGFVMDVGFYTVSTFRIATEYGCDQAYLNVLAGMKKDREVVALITPFGMRIIKKINPMFYRWYLEEVAPAIPDLYRIFVDLPSPMPEPAP